MHTSIPCYLNYTNTVPINFEFSVGFVGVLGKQFSMEEKEESLRGWSILRYVVLIEGKNRHTYEESELQIQKLKMSLLHNYFL